MAAYLDSSEYAAYGLPATFDATLVSRASTLIDAHCHRPHGLAPAEHKEEIRLPPDRNRTILTYFPVLTVSAAAGRYSYPRRGQQRTQLYPAASLYQLATWFGGPPVWTDIDPTEILVDQNSNFGEVWFPAGIYLVHYTEIKITYTAGYNPIPPEVKMATAAIAQALQARATVGGPGIRSMRAGDRQQDFWSPSVIDADTRTLLERYRVKALR